MDRDLLHKPLSGVTASVLFVRRILLGSGGFFCISGCVIFCGSIRFGEKSTMLCSLFTLGHLSPPGSDKESTGFTGQGGRDVC